MVCPFLQSSERKVAFICSALSISNTDLEPQLGSWLGISVLLKLFVEEATTGVVRIPLDPKRASWICRWRARSSTSTSEREARSPVSRPKCLIRSMNSSSGSTTWRANGSLPRTRRESSLRISSRAFLVVRTTAFSFVASFTTSSGKPARPRMSTFASTIQALAWSGRLCMSLSTCRTKSILSRSNALYLCLPPRRQCSGPRPRAVRLACRCGFRGNSLLAPRSKSDCLLPPPGEE
mmetsp:Transcript_17030/g.41798  ORF Transcript_17030/g.41798 Transcript_17030/m.41798 type:complete len:236 (-) Transcript_17030:101-808(-)